MMINFLSSFGDDDPRVIVMSKIMTMAGKPVEEWLELVAFDIANRNQFTTISN